MVSRHHIPIPKIIFKITLPSASCTLVPTGNRTPDRLCHGQVGKEAVVQMKVRRKKRETTLPSFFTLDVQRVPDFFSGLRHFTGFVSVGFFNRTLCLLSECKAYCHLEEGG